MKPENNNKRWTTTEIDRVLLGGHRGELIANVAATIGRTTKAVRQRANELGIGYMMTDAGEILKNEINHYELTGNFAGQETTTERPVREVVLGIVENLTKLKDEDRFLYDLINGLTDAARVMSRGVRPTPNLDKLFNTEPTYEDMPTIDAIIEVEVTKEVTVAAPPQEVIIYKDRPAAIPLDLSGNKVIEDIFKNGNSDRIIDVKRILGGNRSNFMIDGKSFHLGKKEEKVVNGYLYTLTNSDTGMVLAQQKTSLSNGAETTIASRRLV